MENNVNQNAEVQNAVNTALKEQKKMKKKKTWIIIAIVAVILILIVAISGGDSEETSVSGENASQSVDAEKDVVADGKIGDYVCKVKSASICKDWVGEDAVKVVYEFTNNNSEPQSFDGALEINLYQDGVGLETTFTSSDDDSSIYDVEIKNGVTKEVIKYYVLRDKTTPIEVEITELFSFDDTKITTTINL
ncbi:MAG: DUF5067 domain-containing protein [Clostridia bacterium]|nr:DUF5067 domain-containing protein [Clostridia bacterium]